MMIVKGRKVAFNVTLEKVKIKSILARINLLLVCY